MRSIRTITLLEDSVEISYMDLEADVRAQGNVWVAHTAVINRASYEALSEDLEEAAGDLLAQALQDWQSSLPVALEPPPEPEDDDPEDDD